MPVRIVPSRSPKGIPDFIMTIRAFIEGKSGDTPKDNMEETGDGTVHSPSSSSDVIRANIVACRCPRFNYQSNHTLIDATGAGRRVSPEAFMR